MATKKRESAGFCWRQFALTIPSSFVHSTLAVEGGLGRPISGMQIAPFAGVIPPEPGLAVATGETYFDGSIGVAESCQ